MRFIEEKDWDSPPPSLIKCVETHGHKVLIYDEKLRQCCKPIKPDLEKIYHGKCAYCESFPGPAAPGEVEHYRPLKSYWWLAFEWTNLLFACPTCNRKKGNKFPIKDETKRITKPGSAAPRVNSNHFIEEESLLLNPELDDPQEHLVYKPYFENKMDVYLQGTSSKGKTTIEVCDLNRAKLKENYKRQVDVFINDLLDKTAIIFSFIERKLVRLEENERHWFHIFYFNTFQRLKKLQEPGTPGAYTQLGCHMYDEFDRFIVQRLPRDEKIRIIVKRAFLLFKEGELEGKNKNG
jgi:uncharacterized protein (TIGR02646 family)